MRILSLILILCFSQLTFAQSARDLKAMSYTSPEELVSLSGTIPFNQAMQVLSKVSKQSINKIIVGGENVTEPIGVDIVSTNWFRALQIILKVNNYEYQETADYIKIQPQKETIATLPVPEILKGIDFNTREVSISAIFFEMDVTKSKEIGMDWKWLLSNKAKDFNLGGQLGKIDSRLFEAEGTTTTTTQEEQNKFNLGTSSKFDLFKLSGNITAIFNFFEAKQIGEIIASPQITVKDRVSGDIQVGSDFSTREKDFAGNTIERFYSTGTIIRVTPYVLDEDGKKYILLDLTVERSSATPGQISTEIKKTKASTKVLLLDGEETVIGGLYINDVSTERSGIPFLKDLPWWVFGIRYLTGSDAEVVKKKELIIVLKAKLLPTLQERLVSEKEGKVNPMLERLQKNEQEIKFYQMNLEEEKK